MLEIGLYGLMRILEYTFYTILYDFIYTIYLYILFYTIL